MKHFSITYSVRTTNVVLPAARSQRKS